MLVGVVDGVALVGSEAMLVGVGPFVTVLVEVGDGVLLVGNGEGTLVVVWPCVAVPVGVVDGVPPVGCSVPAFVEAGLPVASTVLVLLVVLGPVKCAKYILYYRYVYEQPFCKGL